MSNFIKIFSKQKIISFLLVICMILPIMPMIGVSAAVSGMTYYEHSFELPLYGATGCPVKDVAGITAGTAFTILEEQGNNLKVKLSNGTETTIAKEFCMINLPDVVPSIKYNITNSYSSVLKVLGNNITNITGTSIYQNGTSKKNNPRLGKDEFLVPVLYETAIKMAAAQKKALSEDYTLVVYEAYRPIYAQDKVYNAYNPLVDSQGDAVTGGWDSTWFVANGKSNHQEGYALDVSLAKVTGSSTVTLSNPSYKRIELTVQECEMITPIHELSYNSRIFTAPVTIYSDTAWQSATPTAEFAASEPAKRLQKYMTDAGFAPLSSEWWHFNDVSARDALGDKTSITGSWELTKNSSILKAQTVVTSGGEILIESDDYNDSTGTVSYPRVIHLPGGSVRYPGAIVPSEDVVTSNGYYMNENGEKIFAFCIDPTKDGAAEVAGGSYYVTLSEKLTDKFEIAALRLCEQENVNNLLYPGLSFSDMDYWVNYAVKIVIKFYEMTGKNKSKTLEEINNLIQVSPPRDSSFIPVGDNEFGNKVIAAIKNAYNWIIANENSTLASGNIEVKCITSNLNELESETEFSGPYKGEFEVKIDGNPDAKFKVEFTQGSGSYFSSFKLCDASGTPFTDGFAHEFTNGDHFWIIGDLPELEPNTRYDEDHSIKVTAIGEYGEEYWIGTPADSSIQRYAFIAYNNETTKDSNFWLYDERPMITNGSLRIGKINSTTGQPVPGAKFLVEQIDGSYSTTVTVGSDGYYSLNDIPEGSYRITEIYVPKPLIVDPTPKTIYIDPATATEDTPITIEFVNEQMVCVHIYKYDSKTNELLNGAQFQLSRKDEVSALFAGITGESKCTDCGLCKNPCDADGVICFGPLDKGWYTVTEVNSAPGYIHDPATPAVQTFEVTGKEIQEIELKFDNKRRPELKIIKKDPDGVHLADVEFEIWKSGTQEKFSGKTDSNGEIYITWDNENYPLSEGSYSIKEINVPAGYVLSDEVKEVMLVGNTLSEVVFVNPKRPGLTITKTDNEGNPLDGVTFELWKSGTDTKYSAVTINGQIILEWDNADFPLEAGSYSIRETAVPRGYILDTTVKEALLENGKMVIIPFTNNKRPELEIMKVDTAGNPLEGAVFTIKRAGTTTEYEFTTDADGRIYIPYDSALYPLEPDRYIITEKQAPEHYILSTPNYQEVVLEANTCKTVIFANPEKPKMTIEKYDRRGDGSGGLLPLTPVTFQIWKTDGSYDQTLTTDANGKIRITDLLPGEYHIKETATKDGYILSPEVRTIILKGDDDVTVTFYNDKRPELLIVKLDGKTGRPLSGAHFQVSKGDEVLFQDLVTDANGEILITYNDSDRLLETGTYKVTEIAAPMGYDIVLPASKNVVLREGERTRVEFNDIRKPTLIVTKRNALTLKPIPNTFYNIKWESPTGGVHDLGNWYTDKNGQIILPFVEVGWYIITEIKAAPGMSIAKNPVTRIYLAPGTNAYSYDELTDSQNSSGENGNSTGPVSGNENDSSNGTGIVVWTPNQTGSSGSGSTTTSGNGIIIWRPSTGYENSVSAAQEAAPDAVPLSEPPAVPAFEFCPDIEAMSDVGISGIDAEDITDTVGENSEVLIETESVPEQVFTAEEIENRVLGENESELYHNENYEIQTIGGDGVFVDDSGRQWKLEISGDEVKFVLANSQSNLKLAAFGGKNQFGNAIASVASISAVSSQIGIIPLADNNGEIIDFPLNAVIVKKVDAVTGQLLAGATFELYRMSDEISGQNGTLLERFTTDNSGIIAFIGLPAGTYFVKEVKSPANYTLNVQGVQTALFAPDSTSNIAFTFANYPYGSILVDKIDAVTNKPLAGARFELKTSAGAHVGYGTTDNTGHILFSNVEPGSYIISEVEAPRGYQIDTAPQTVYVSADGKTYTVYFKNQPYGTLMIVKKDRETNRPISGVTFHVTDIHGANIGDITPGNGFAADGMYTTDNNGEIRIDHIPEGHYLITEVYAPSPYLIDDTPKVAFAEFGKIKTIEFWNSKKGALVISKYDAVTKQPLAGATFMVTDSRGAVVGESAGLYTTDETGHVLIYDLQPGAYRVYESQAPSGYILDSTVQTIHILDEKMYYLEFFDQPVNSFTIMKYDADTREPLANATFRVTKLGSTKTIIGEFITDANGKITIDDLLPGSYEIEEIKAPANYVLDRTVQTIALEQNKPQVVTFFNYRYGDLLITKINSKTKAPIEGVKFKITRQNGEFVGEYITDTDGYISLSNLEPGFYIIQETECPPEYVRDITPKTVEIKSNQLQSVQFANKPKSRVHLRKLDADTGAGVQGAVFTVEKGSTLIGTYTSGTGGEVEVGLLDPGDYVFTEITPPPNYSLNGGTNDIQRMSITDTNEVTVTFQNHAYGNLLIIKRDEFDNHPLAGAEFTVSYANGAFYGNYTTMSDGTILIPNIEPGIYLIRETRAPSGYLLDNAAKTVTVPAVVTTETVFLNRPKSGIQINKIDKETRGALSGAEFKVTKPNGEVIGTKVTDIGGNIIFDNLEPGTYIVTETRSPEGYVLDAVSQTAVVTSDKITTVTFENRPLSDILIIKRDSVTKVPLSGAVFKITKPDGALVGTYTTNVSGVIQVGDLTPGTYVVSETAAPAGYVLDNIPRTIEVKSGKIIEVEFENTPHSGIQIIKKNSETGNTVAGAEFKVTKFNGETVGTYTTDSSGTVIVENLAPGHYTITENKAPQFYVLNSTPQTVEVKSGKLSSIEFLNIPYGSLVIAKTNAQNGAGLEGAVFEVKKVSGEFIGRFTTGADGIVIVRNLVPGTYIVTEVSAPAGYELDSSPQTIQVGAGSGTGSTSSGTGYPEGSTSMTFVSNNPYGTLEVVKLDKVDKNKALEGATFELRKADGTYVDTQITDVNGKVFFGQLKSGNYVITETIAPKGYEIDTASKNVTITAGNPASVTFYNNPHSGIEIIKIDSVTKSPLPDATFIIERDNGEKVGQYKTDQTGKIIVSDLEEGVYIISETIAPDGYIRDEQPRTITVKSGVLTIEEFANKPKSGLQIKKTDSRTGLPLSGAKFKITKKSGDIIGEYVTDKSGLILIDTLEPGWYAVAETYAPYGYMLDSTAKDVEITHSKLVTVEFANNPMSGLQIKKIDAKTGTPLRGAKFKVTKKTGDLIGEYVTDVNGMIYLNNLEPGWISVFETFSPEGYLLDSTVKDVEITHSKLTTVEFANQPLASLQIKKIDEVSGAPIAGAQFKVTKQNGEYVGEYTTEKDGLINIPNADPGWYVISEMRAPIGYILDEAPKTIEVKTSTPTIVTFSNKPMSGLHILKLDSQTRTPLEGVEFIVSKMNGERIGTFKTDKGGSIYVSSLESGWYTVQEIKTKENYHLDPAPRNIEVKWGSPIVMEWTNDPYSSLMIKKTVKGTDAPLADVEFSVTKFNGEQIGTYKTDKSGLIVVEGLAEGTYLVRETKTPAGFDPNPTAHEVQIRYGKRTTLEIENTPLASVIIRKVDSETGKGIFGVKFLLYDGLDNPIAQFISDNEGYVWIDRKLSEGKYKLRELEAAPGYLLDDMPRTFYVASGQTTEIIFSNAPMKGQIVLTKRSADYNAVTGLSAGSLLGGAVFEIVNTTGNVVAKITSDAKGIAASKPLPPGVYFIREVTAPKFYELNTKEIWAEIKHNGDIVKLEVLNKSVTLDVTIRKKAQTQVSPGQNITYEIYDVKNNSSVTLKNFYIHDRIPTDATRASKLITGTYSERMTYRITYKTNYHSEYFVLAENLSTKNSYEYSLHSNVLGLANGEYVTDVRLEFPQASPGFKTIESMKIIAQVLPTVPKDYKIVNRADVGGHYLEEWETANASTTSIAWKEDLPAVPLPKTGY